MKKFARILVCALLLVSLLAGCGNSSKFNSLASKMEAVDNGDFSAYAELTPASYWEYYEEKMDEDADDVIDYIEEKYEGSKDVDGVVDRREKLYGKDTKVTVEVIAEKKVEDEKLDDIAKALKDSYEIKKDTVTDAYKVVVKKTFKGEDDRDMDSYTYHAVKIDGEWYLCSVYTTTNEDGKETTEVSFVFDKYYYSY